MLGNRKPGGARADALDRHDLPGQGRRRRQTHGGRAGADEAETRGPDGGPNHESRWAAELVARTLGLTGPNLVLDAASAGGSGTFDLDVEILP